MPADDERPVWLGYGLALFDFEPASVITPHAPRCMASAHMVVDGLVRVMDLYSAKD
jgi:hypothetical protein